MIIVTSNHRHAAIILILTELYTKDYTKKHSNTGGWLFDDYANYDGLNENQKEDLFGYAAKQLKDLALIDFGAICKHTGQITNPRLTGQGELILARLFENESLNNFFQLNPIDSTDTKKIIIEKIQEVGIDVVVKVLYEGLKEGYTGLLKMF
jgi:hypothetical protein